MKYFYQINTILFKKTKQNSKNISNSINGMSWDLTHIRIIERLYSFTFDDYVKFGIHPILTYDNGLKDILKLCPVKKVVIYDRYVFCWLKTPFCEIFPKAKELMFDDKIVEKRRKVFENRSIECIREELEAEIEKTIK